jgi:LacI family transcriptional regulator
MQQNKHHVIGLCVSAQSATFNTLMDGMWPVWESRQDVRLDYFPLIHLVPRFLKARASAYIVEGEAIGPLIDAVFSMHVPTVVLNRAELVDRAAVLCLDDRAIGQTAAKYFLDRHLPHLAYYGFENSVSQARWEGFAEAARAAGREPYSPAYNRPAGESLDWFNMIDPTKMAAWLLALPKPVGILAFNDRVANDLLKECWRLEIPCPQEIAIVGVDNSPIYTEHSLPTISSVDTRASELGYRAARTVLDLLDGREVPEKVQWISPRGVVERESSSVFVSEDPLLSEAMRYVFTHLEENFTVADLTRALGISRSTVDRMFRKQFSRTPADVIRSERLKRAKELLFYGDLPLAEVAARCGFDYLTQFSRAFKKQFGQTPNAYRKTARFPRSASR